MNNLTYIIIIIIIYNYFYLLKNLIFILQIILISYIIKNIFKNNIFKTL